MIRIASSLFSRSKLCVPGTVACRSLGSVGAGMNPIEDSIRTKLSDLKPTVLDVINESHKHNVPKNSETHFKVVVVSEHFESYKLIERHRLINNLLKDEFEKGLHALSIVAKTPKQWEKVAGRVRPSPPCLGGSGR